MAVKIKYLKDVIKEKSDKVFNILYHNYREDLDKQITIIDLSYDTLRVNLYSGNTDKEDPLAHYDYVHDVLVKVAREKMPESRTVTTLLDPKAKQIMRNSAWTYFLVDGGPNNFFMVANGIKSGTARGWLTDNLSKDPRLINTNLGTITRKKEVRTKTAAGRELVSTKTITRSAFDIGHISTEGNENLSSPLEKKIENILDFGVTTKNTRVTELAKKALKDLYAIQADFSYVFKKVAEPHIEAARATLGTGYLVVTLHTQYKNEEFAHIETKIFSELEAGLALSLASSKSSNSLVEDLAIGFADIIEFGKTVRPRGGSNTSGKVSKDLSTKVKATSEVITLARRTKNIAEQPISLAALQVIINESLGERIADNMGTGMREDILNFQSGRFASTVEVERMSASREGMITAFYRYMKYPYATFEPEGLQGLPKSRDPKLLISKSIREIAAKIVGNRMRAVSL